jgi:hypothetical protein
LCLYVFWRVATAKDEWELQGMPFFWQPHDSEIS